MMFSKYALEDFLAIKEHKATYQDIAKKYNTSVGAIKKAMHRARVCVKKTGVVLTEPNGKVTKFGSMTECAYAVGVSAPTIMRVLHGKRSRLLEELGIKVEEVIPVYAQEEYID